MLYFFSIHFFCYPRLHQEIEKIIEAELQGRKIALSNGEDQLLFSHSTFLICFKLFCEIIGVRELSGIIALKPNKFDAVDEKVHFFWLIYFCT